MCLSSYRHRDQVQCLVQRGDSCLTLILLIAATISIRLPGRPTSKLPMYCKTQRKDLMTGCWRERMQLIMWEELCFSFHLYQFWQLFHSVLLERSLSSRWTLNKLIHTKNIANTDISFLNEICTFLRFGDICWHNPSDRASLSPLEIILYGLNNRDLQPYYTHKNQSVVRL